MNGDSIILSRLFSTALSIVISGAFHADRRGGLTELDIVTNMAQKPKQL